jgi:hypothetical protein
MGLAIATGDGSILEEGCGASNKLIKGWSVDSSHFSASAFFDAVDRSPKQLMRTGNTSIRSEQFSAAAEQSVEQALLDLLGFLTLSNGRNEEKLLMVLHSSVCARGERRDTYRVNRGGKGEGMKERRKGENEAKGKRRKTTKDDDASATSTHRLL